ncbi:class I SAM-dependent methyltransferase [Geodermatophilus sabuli]|nr:class I SAM-dependent methyltransferase [Geodermatophilus sabuli]
MRWRMRNSRSSGCRACGTASVVTVLDLGTQPVADDLFDDAGQAAAAPRHRLALGCCQECGLVQLDASTPVLANAAHGHGSVYSGTVLQHERAWVAELLEVSSLRDGGSVLDVSSGAGGLLRVFADAGHVVRGWERDAALARQASAAGLPTDHDDGMDLGPGETFDLVVVNHSLSHADDLDAAVERCVGAVAPTGTLAVEFHSVSGVLGGGQFDVICHAHRSYLSLGVLAGVLARHGMTITDARSLPLHGGVVRLQARHTTPGLTPAPGAVEIMAAEATQRSDRPEAWASAAIHADRVRSRLRTFIAESRSAGHTVAAYGAPSRGATLLNFCGLRADQIPWTADRAPAKQGRFLPGVATAVIPPEELLARRPDVVVVLVWPLRSEVLAQLDDLRRAGTRFVFPLPEPEVVA